MTKSGRLRALLRRPGLVPMVGAHDAVSAKLIESYPRAWAATKS
jgi:2-methylisocitrate lyase-like PEP mutase family enzyme